MSSNATGWDTRKPGEAYTVADRVRLMRWFIDRMYRDGTLAMVRPGYVAGTYGVTKEEVREEIKRHNELAGEGK